MSRVDQLGLEITADRQEFRRVQQALNAGEVLEGFADLPAMDAELLRMDAALKPKESTRDELIAIEQRETSAILPAAGVPAEEQPGGGNVWSLLEYNRSVAGGIPVLPPASSRLFADQIYDSAILEPYLRGESESPEVMLTGLLDEWLPSRHSAYLRAVQEGTGVQSETVAAERLQGAIPWDGLTPAPREQRNILGIIPRRVFSRSPFNFSIQTSKITAEQVEEGRAATLGTWQTKRPTVNLVRVRSRVEVSEDALMSTPELEGILREDSMYGVLDQLNEQIIQGDGTGQNLTGFASGRTATDRLNGIGVVADGGRFASPNLGDRAMWNAINTAEQAIVFNGDAVMTHVVVTPNVFFPTRIEYDENGAGWVWSNPASPLAMRAWGVPVIASSGFASNGADVIGMICGDFSRYSMLSTMGDVSIQIGYNGDGFGEYEKTIRASIRADLVIKRTSAFYLTTWAA